MAHLMNSLQTSLPAFMFQLEAGRSRCPPCRSSPGSCSCYGLHLSAFPLPSFIDLSSAALRPCARLADSSGLLKLLCFPLAKPWGEVGAEDGGQESHLPFTDLPASLGCRHLEHRDWFAFLISYHSLFISSFMNVY